MLLLCFKVYFWNSSVKLFTFLIQELEREPTKAPTKELVYAELDLQSADESPAIHSPQTEQIEYVELDFKKTAEQSSEQSMEQS